MPFPLEVQFRGLCLFVMHPDNHKVAVVMPDGRATSTPNPVVFADGKTGTPHVGYLACDLADVEGMGGVTGELVHRFDRETLEFGARLSLPEPHTVLLPDIGCLAPELQPLEGTFSDDPPGEVLMRTVLDGGRLESSNEGSATWHFGGPPGELGTLGKCGGRFTERVTWRADVDADHLELQFSHWDKKPAVPLRLRPSTPGGVVRMTVANLCADNPLGWRELGDPSGIAVGASDDDFRWFYRILEPRIGTSSTVFTGDAQLPVPQLARPGGRGQPPGCEGGQVRYAF